MPDPIHPLIVHLPMALVVLLPLFAVGAMIAIRRGASAPLAWSVPLVLAAMLAGSSFIAVRTGETEEDRVEAVVPESALHRHEEAAERFLVITGVVLLVAAGGVLGGTFGAALRGLATAGSIVALAAGVQVGAAGGELVYRHDAGSAYATQHATSNDAVSMRRERDD